MKKIINLHAATIFFFVFLFLFFVNCNGLIAQQSKFEIENISKEVLKLIKSADFKRLSEYVHKSRGLQFSPYDDVYDGGPEITKLLKANVKNFFSIKQTYIGGVYDGSGFDIQLTPKEYYHKFIYDIDFENKSDVVFIGDIKGSHKNNFTFFPSRLQVIFARSEDTKSSKELAIPPVLHLQIEQI